MHHPRRFGTCSVRSRLRAGTKRPRSPPQMVEMTPEGVSSAHIQNGSTLLRLTHRQHEERFLRDSGCIDRPRQGIGAKRRGGIHRPQFDPPGSPRSPADITICLRAAGRSTSERSGVTLRRSFWRPSQAGTVASGSAKTTSRDVQRNHPFWALPHSALCRLIFQRSVRSSTQLCNAPFVSTTPIPPTRPRNAT